MAKRQAKASTTKVQKSASKDSVNKRVLRSIVLKGKQEDNDDSNSIEEDKWTGVNGVIEPPYPLLNLTMLRENSSELQQCIDAMIINIDSFGYRLVEHKLTEEQKKKHKTAILKEKSTITSFLDNINYDESLTKLRKATRRNQEDCGNAYWEMIPNRAGTGISEVKKLKAHTMRLIKTDNRAQNVDIYYYDKFSGEIKTRKSKKKFRRFAQIVGIKKVYFKEYGDIRNISCEDGKVIPNSKLGEAKKKGILATSVYHFKIDSDRTPYGIPRYVGNLFSIYGSRASDEINYVTFENNNIPSMIVMVSNGQLTGESIDRVQEFIDTKIKGSNNRSSFLIIEAEPSDDVAVNPGTMKMDIKDLSSTQKEDQLFQNYDKNNAEKVRRCFRLPPSLVGKFEGGGKDIAEEKKLAEEQVFKPERDDFDQFLNRFLIKEKKMKFHSFKSKSINITNDSELVKLLSTGEKTGGVTPNLARMVLGEVLNEDIPQYDPEKIPFDADIPLSYSLVEMSKVVGGNDQTGKIAPNQGQIPAEEVKKELMEGLETDIVKEIMTGLGLE